jgi:plastocyanin
MLALIVLLQQTPVAPSPAATRIARIAVMPAPEVTVSAGDTVRLGMTAYDASGNALDPARLTVRWFQSGGRFEGSVSDEGVVVAGAPGSLTAAVRVAPAEGGAGQTAFATIVVQPGPAARVAITPAPATLLVGQSLVLAAQTFSAAGDPRRDAISWSASAPSVLAVSPSGRVTARAPGRAVLRATAGRAVAELPIVVQPNTVATFAIAPSAVTVKTGDVVRFRVEARQAGGRLVREALAEWSFSPGNAQLDPDGAFVAEQPGSYRVVATFAGRSADAVVTVQPRDAVRPTTIVGRLPIRFPAGEFWLHPSGQAGYLTTLADRMYAIDVRNPSRPVITDSVLVDARVVNDVMTTEDGRFGVMTREGSSSRKDGIVVLSFEDPFHPRVVSEFTETVSGGVHSTFVYRDHVYLTDDATGSMRVIDLRDPRQPKQVARWETPRTSVGRTLHDIDVQDGLAYLSYWNDGLVILDVGNGVKGGSPSNPQFVSQIRYDLPALYREVEALGGPGYIRGTHTAWRHKNYVFVGDEVFSARPVGIGPLGLGRAYGRLHVVDVSDLERPKLVAWYEPKDGGAHNVWVAGDTLYLGDYQGGLRVVDIAGELRGDLLRQGREIAHVMTGDKDGVIPNAPMTWGAVVRNGLIFAPDVNSGLWIVRVEAKSNLVP